MKKTGAELVRFALEQMGVRHTFGVPGVHNTEIYDQLAGSPSITPIRVTHEGNGAFMADAISRTSAETGTLVIVPAAGPAMAAPGIGEASLAGVPMLVITGGIRNDRPNQYQLHEMDQARMLEPITKGQWRVETHREIVPTLYEAWRLANSGEPGPVLIEIPVNLQLFPGEAGNLPPFLKELPPVPIDVAAVEQAATLLRNAKRPGLFIGWGARDASALIVELAERLGAPVATTLQGLSVFPADHPLHTGFGIGRYAVPAAEEAFRDCDVLIAIGNRFGEIASGSFGIEKRWKLIHIDINPRVFNTNYPADVAFEADATDAVRALLAALPAEPRESTQGKTAIANAKRSYVEEWYAHDSGARVNPARFLTALRAALPRDAYVAVDDGNHTFLVAELFPVLAPKHLISPSDFNCMGYCVPAAIGLKLAHPEADVVGIAGDGAFLMTAMEISTASEHGLGILFCVFNDGELSQIAQAQALPYNRKACTVLPQVRIKGLADATGAAYFRMETNADIETVLKAALTNARDGKPTILDINVDYSKQTRFTKGVVKTNLERFSLGDKARMIGRAIWRRINVPD